MRTAWQTIRVFISSTFRDMHAERDWLVRFVFPRLREELLSFRIHLEDVDLRWGVTSDQDALDVCMEAIDNCHPRFICILGGRYGWVPPPQQIPAGFLNHVLAGASAAGSLTSLESEALGALYRRDNGGRAYRLKEKPRTNVEVEAFNAWGEVAVGVLQRAEFTQAQRSITASEIQFGALDKLQRPTFRFFYFREDRVTNAIPEPYAKEYREPPDSPAAGFLEAIKARIKDPVTRGRVLVAPSREEKRPLIWREYPCEWDTATSRIIKLQKFGELVYNDLLASVIAQFGVAPEPKEAQTDAEQFAEENASIEAFVEERSEHFVLGSRETVRNALLDHERGTGDSGYVCLTGAHGSGKSALLAHLVKLVANSGAWTVVGFQTPRIERTSALFIPHFVGVSPGSTEVRHTLRRLCHELKAGCPEITADIPEDPEKLCVAFLDVLRQACASTRVVILLDAVNQFNTASQLSGLYWLPEELPGNVRVILSTLASAEDTHADVTDSVRGVQQQALIDAVRRLKPCEIELEPLTVVDRTAIIGQFCRRYRKQFDPEQIELLLGRNEFGELNKADSDKPLYLLAALEELRTLGTYEEITQRITELPPTAQELFTWILARLEKDDGFRDAAGKTIGRELVSRFAALLGASRYGLSQRELMELLAPGESKADPPLEPDPQGNVAALLRLLRPYLMHRGELLDFYHGQFREAAEEAWLKTDAQRHTANCILAHYFATPALPKALPSDNAQRLQWLQATAHALSEAPFHLATCGMQTTLERIFSDICYLDSRCLLGAVSELIDDFDLLNRPTAALVAQYAHFIRAHAQRLAQHRGLLFTLISHEGFAEAQRHAREFAVQGTWPRAWLETKQVASFVPHGGEAFYSIEVLTRYERDCADRAACACLAEDRQLAFVLDRLGAITLIDVTRSIELAERIETRAERPLRMWTSTNADALAVGYENGEADLFRLAIDEQGNLMKLSRIAAFDYLVPEYEPPVMGFIANELWYQAPSGKLCRIRTSNAPQADPVSMDALAGELSGIANLDAFVVVTHRVARDTGILLLSRDGRGIARSRRDGADVITLAPCGACQVGIAYSDQRIVIYNCGDIGDEGLQLVAEVAPTIMACVGDQLVWGDRACKANLWDFHADMQPRAIQVEGHNWAAPFQLAAAPNETCCLVGPQCCLRFRLRTEQTDGGAPLLAFFPHDEDDVSALQSRSNGIWLIGGRDTTDTWITREPNPFYVFGRDGHNRVLGARMDGAGFVVDLTNRVPVAVESLPNNVTSIAGCRTGGFWLADAWGVLYFVGTDNVCRRLGQPPFRNISRSSIFAWNDLLIWIGMCTGPSADNVDAIMLFETIGNGNLRRIGERIFPPGGVLCDLTYDTQHDRLFLFWRRHGCDEVRYGSVHDWLVENESGPIVLARGGGISHAHVAPDGSAVYVLRQSGHLFRVNSNTLAIEAVLAPTHPFTSVPLEGHDVLAADVPLMIGDSNSRIYSVHFHRENSHELQSNPPKDQGSF